MHFIIIPRIFRNFFREKLLQDFSLFREKTAAKKFEKIWLKNTTFGQNWAEIHWLFGRINKFLPSTSKCLKNVPDFKSHNLPIHFHASFKKETFKKGHLLPIYGITYFSHFFRTFAKNCTFLSFFAKKVKCEKMPRSTPKYVLLHRVTWNQLGFPSCYIEAPLKRCRDFWHQSAWIAHRVFSA